MSLLTFRVKKPEILAKKKTKTIRANAERWLKMAQRAHDKKGSKLLHIWWKNPRTRRYNPDCYKMGIARWTGFYTIHGHEITAHLAFEDGFDTVEELLEGLARENNMTHNDVMAHLWVVIEFEWVDGPYTQEEAGEYIPPSRWAAAKKDMKAMFEGKPPEEHGFTQEPDGSYTKRYY